MTSTTVRPVLVIEDDVAMNRLLCRRLEQAGLVASGVLSGAEAMEELERETDRLLLLDYLLPDTDARRFVIGLRERGLTVPFIVMTGHGDERVAVEMMKLGARDYVTKQVDFIDLLIEVIRQVYRALEAEQDLLKARTDLCESDDRFRRVFENVSDAILILATDGRTLYANPGSERTFGVGCEELSGRHLFELVHPEDAERVIRAFGRTARVPGSPSRVECRIRLGDETERFVEMLCDNLASSGQSPAGVVVVIRDVTERKRTEEELASHRNRLEGLVEERTREMEEAHERVLRQEKLVTLGRLAATVAHEVRNPLSVICNASFFLQRTVAERLDGKALRHLRAIDEQIERANQAITAIHDYTQARPTDPIRCAIRPILERAADDAAAPQNVRVTLDVQPPHLAAMADDRQLAVVFRNLLSNAVQAMPDGGEVRVSATLKDGRADIALTDAGPGIAPDVLSRLFEPLYTTKPLGVGLGLAICKSLIEANSGTITIASEPGKGTTVTVTLPAADA